MKRLTIRSQCIPIFQNSTGENKTQLMYWSIEFDGDQFFELEKKQEDYQKYFELSYQLKDITFSIVAVASVSMVSLFFEVFTTTFIFPFSPSLSSAMMNFRFFKTQLVPRLRLCNWDGEETDQDGTDVSSNFKVLFGTF